ncbi:hypothetical protein QOT17_016100 [Balamuthia mandrillaris]
METTFGDACQLCGVSYMNSQTCPEQALLPFPLESAVETLKWRGDAVPSCGSCIYFLPHQNSRRCPGFLTPLWRDVTGRHTKKKERRIRKKKRERESEEGGPGRHPPSLL